jgi:hypothetical protein
MRLKTIACIGRTTTRSTTGHIVKLMLAIRKIGREIICRALMDITCGWEAGLML